MVLQHSHNLDESQMVWSIPRSGRPSGVTVAIQRSTGDRTIVEHIGHLKDHVEDCDGPIV